MNKIVIKSGKAKQLSNHHPWVFSGAIEICEAEEPSVCRIEKRDGEFIAYGWYDKDSHIPVHLLSWNVHDTIDDAWWKNTVAQSILRRKNFFKPDSTTTTFRIIFSEADMIPGVVADVYGKTVRIIISARVGWDHKDLIVQTIDTMLSPRLIVLTTDQSFAGVEGLKKTTLFYKEGAYFTPNGKIPPIAFREDGLIYEMIPGGGQKSGFYCDQRDNRQKIEKYCAGATVLDGCCYNGGFTLHALRAGAESVDCLDSSEPALHDLLRHVHINEDQKIIAAGSRERVTTKACDIFQELRQIKDNYYDVMILDPPKLAQTKSQADKAARAYKDLNRLAMTHIKDGGIIATFSCSSAIGPADLRKILAWASMDAKCEVQILESLTAGSDHPVRLSFPESEYLCGYIIKVIKY